MPELLSNVCRMNLEDHIGDIVRKAREMSGMAMTRAAQAAGLSADHYAAFEETGVAATKTDLEALAALVGLNGTKLAGIAGGWLPSVKDLALWRELRVTTSARGSFTVNCFLAWDEVTREAALFDTGFDAAPITGEIENNKLQLRHIFITHSHPDHVACLDELSAKFPKARLHTDAHDAPPQHRNRRNDCIQLGSLRITNRPTPGHADDGVTYLIGNWPEDAAHVAIVGDALFAGSAGGAGEAWPVACRAVKEQILSLPADTLLCPGHGPLTTVEEEKKQNPFF